MDRRQALGLVGASVLAPAAFADAAPARPATPPSVPPRLTGAELAARVKVKGFAPKSLYAHEIAFVGVVQSKGPVSLLQIKGMDGPYAQVFLHGGEIDAAVGRELAVVGLIVDTAYGALTVWKRECRYADAEAQR